MTLDEGKTRFIQAWGALGSDWGINRTMGQIHALLLLASEPLSAQDVMDDLRISLGNANMNLRALIDWGLVYKQHKPGERKDYFIAEKDMWEVMKRIIAQRKKKELEPLSRVLDDVKSVKNDSPEAAEFHKIVEEITDFSGKAENVLDKLVKSDSNWIIGTFLKKLMS